MAGPIEDAGRPFEENRFYASGSHAGADRRMADLRNGDNPFVSRRYPTTGAQSLTPPPNGKLPPAQLALGGPFLFFYFRPVIGHPVCPNFGLDSYEFPKLYFGFQKMIAMPVTHRICAKCGQPTKLMLSLGGKGPRTYQCIHCDRPDPLKSAEIRNLIDGLLSHKES